MRRVVVTGGSMRPALEPGDRLVVLRPRFRRLRPGDVVALRDPRRPERLLVKRVARLLEGGTQVLVLGDEPIGSTDSRSFGPVGRDAVVGRAVYRYAPPGRAGRLR